MLHYGIGALLIVLIITIVLSYHYNAEGFATVTAAAKNPQIVSSNDAIIDTTRFSQSEDKSTVVAAPSNSKELALSTRKVGTVDKRAPSQNDKTNNIDNGRKIDKVSIKTDYDGDFLRLFASTPGLPDPDALKYWVISRDPLEPPVWETIIVSNDENYVSATIPPEYYSSYINKILYLVPKGSNNYGDAVTTFRVPQPRNGPNVINPRVNLSDTGYNAMKLNKHSNLLNDVQKIIHNEMLANRSLDVIVKNPNTKTVPGISAGAGTDTTSAAIRAVSNNVQQNGSCNESSSSSCNSCNSCKPSDSDPDMSKYIRKDQIPCWGCSLDY